MQSNTALSVNIKAKVLADMANKTVKQTAVVLLNIWAGLVFAEDNDKDVGVCVGYLVMTKRDGGPEDAMKLAVNQRAVMQHGKIFINKWKQLGPDLSGGDACRRLGIMPSSYRMAK